MIALSFIMLSMLFVGVNAWSVRYNHWYQSGIQGVVVYGDYASNTIHLESGSRSGYAQFTNNYPVAENIYAGHFALDVGIVLDPIMFQPYNTAYAKISIGMDIYYQDYMVVKITSNDPCQNVAIYYSIDGIHPYNDVTWYHPARQNYPPYHDYKFVFRFESIVSPMLENERYNFEHVYRIEIRDAVTGDLDHVLMPYEYSKCSMQTLVKPTYKYTEYIDMGNWMYVGYFTTTASMFQNKLGCHSDIRNSDAICNMMDTGFVAQRVGQQAYDRREAWWFTTDDWMADVNDDGKVDMRDVAYIANHFGIPP